jgi:hypothetical protein
MAVFNGGISIRGQRIEDWPSFMNEPDLRDCKRLKFLDMGEVGHFDFDHNVGAWVMGRADP